MKIFNIKLFSKKSSIKDAGNDTRNPHTVWITIISVTVSSLVVFAGVHYFLFASFNTDTDAAEIAAQNTKLRVIREDRLSIVASYLKGKEERRNNILENPPVIVDPSL